MEIRRVDVGGYELSARVRAGAGVPVVFVSGLGETHKAWESVLAALPDSLPVVTYDRAGLGESDPYPPSLRTAVTYRQAASDLRAVLQGLDVPSPWLLVGHSYGGCVIRSFADDHPTDIAGIVLADPSVAEMSLPRELERHFREEERDDIYDGDLEHRSRIDNVAGAAQLHAERPPRVPSVVLTRARDRWSKPTPPELDDYWYTQHDALVAKLNAWHIFALDAGHRLNDEAPVLVAQAISAVSKAASGKNPQLNEDTVRESGGRLHRPCGLTLRCVDNGTEAGRR